MKKSRFIRFGLIAATVFIGSAILLSVTASTGQGSSKFNHPGNILITDQFNNRVIEIDPAGNIVWQFGGGPAAVGPTPIFGPNIAERRACLTLMSCTPVPARHSPACP